MYARMMIVVLVVARPVWGGEPETAVVFDPALDGFRSIRIPAVVVTRRGTVLAFAEGRSAEADQAQNRLILKRSRDGGRSWGPRVVVAGDGVGSLNNPCALVDRSNGRILVVHQKYPAGATEINGTVDPGYEGDRVVRNFLITSDDDGATWSSPRDVTRSTKRPLPVTTVASGPGVGIQLRHGRFAGRLLVPFNEGPFELWKIYVVYSDDGGATWTMGAVAPGGTIDVPGKGKRSTVNEAQIVELADGSIRMNARRWAGVPVRKTCLSRDGGASWSPVEDAPELADPSCMASILRVSDSADGEPSRILFSGPEGVGRRRGTVFLSTDEGRSWPVKRVLHNGGFGYSCLTKTTEGAVGCLYETEGASRIVFARFSLDWLTRAHDQTPASIKPAQ